MQDPAKTIKDNQVIVDLKGGFSDLYKAVEKRFKIIAPGEPGIDYKYTFNQDGKFLEVEEGDDDTLGSILKNLGIKRSEDGKTVELAVERKDSSKKEPHEEFLRQIPFLTRGVKRKLLSTIMTKENRDTIAQYVNSKFGEDYVQRVRDWLVVMTIEQKQNMLLDLQKHDVNKVLEFLLKKNK